jgi:hypothetical protein
LDGRDVTGTAFKNDPGFYDVDGGDFAIANDSPQAQVPEGQPQYGDPRWSTWANYANKGLFTEESNDGTPNDDAFNNTTGIDQIETNTPSGDGKWYTLSGALVDKPTHGIYIHNGKKVVIK